MSYAKLTRMFVLTISLTLAFSSAKAGPLESICRLHASVMSILSFSKWWPKSDKAIPLFDPRRGNDKLTSKLHQAWHGVVGSGQYIGGKPVEAFEQNLASAYKYNHAVGCSDGTTALHIALRALIPNAQPSDEVIVPAFTFVATASSVELAGMTPSFADVNLDDALVSLASIESRITPRTKAIIAVDLFGRQAPVDKLRALADKHGLKLIVDGAQSLGVPHNTADVTTTSFYPTKPLGTLGDGGALLTDKPDVALRLQELRSHGSLVRDEYKQVGLTGRLDTLHAAILDVKLPYLDGWNARRREIAQQYNTMLQPIAQQYGLTLPTMGQNPEAHVWALYTLRVPKLRAELVKALSERGIGAGVYYGKSLPEQEAFQGIPAGHYPNANQLAREVLSLPMFPELTNAEVARVASAFKEALAEVYGS